MNLINTYAGFSSQAFGSFPHNEHASPSLLRKGLWDAQVPANSPSFLAQIFIAIPATPRPNKTMLIPISFSATMNG